MALGLTVFQDNKKEMRVLKERWTPSPSNGWVGELHLTKTHTVQESTRLELLSGLLPATIHPGAQMLQKSGIIFLSYQLPAANCHGNSSTPETQGRFSEMNASNTIRKGERYYTHLQDSAVESTFISN